MRLLKPDKLHVCYSPDARPDGPLTPRRYTLTHSDATGELFLTVGLDYNRKQISGLHTRVMRDEVLAEWNSDDGALSLNVYCHVGGGFVFGGSSWRESIFRREMPLVLEVLRYGDRSLFDSNPQLDSAPVFVHYEYAKEQRTRTESWGTPARYR